MRLRALLWPVVAVTALAGCGGGGDEMVPAADGGVNVKTIAEGPRGPLRAGEVVARSRAEWEAAWRDHEGPGEAPSTDGIDFSRAVVVGIFAGQRPSGGYRVVPATVARGSSDLYAVGYELVSPGKGCMTSQALTSPFLVMTIPAAPQVTFSSTERTQDCQ